MLAFKANRHTPVRTLLVLSLATCGLICGCTKPSDSPVAVDVGNETQFGGDVPSDVPTSAPETAGSVSDATPTVDAKASLDAGIVASEVVDAAQDAQDVGELAAAEIAPKPPAPGSLAACALLYKGFDMCCNYDPAQGTWFLEDKPCWGAKQCMIDVDCPAGYIETRELEGGCLCKPIFPQSCTTASLSWVPPGVQCAEGLNRCPAHVPDDGIAYCSACPCEQIAKSLTMFGTLYCPPDKQFAKCPCKVKMFEECCLDFGYGLSCGSNGKWEFFWDCPCGGPFDCKQPMPGLCAAQ